MALRLWRLTSYSLRPDEIFSLETARQGWPGLVVRAARDVVRPPLFYALLKTWIAIGGESELWLRLFPVLTAVATMLPFALLCRELRLGTGATGVALLLMAVNGYLIYYAQELRMYTGKNAWQPLVREMSRAEESPAGGVAVYSFDSSDETIAFYLKQRRDDRFRTRRLKRVTDLDGDHFWGALREPRRRPTEQWLVDQGYVLGEGFSDGFGGRLFPVWRRAPRREPAR